MTSHPTAQALNAAKWLAILIPMAALVGSASALFLWSLDTLTRVRFENPWLLYLLPVAGIAIVWMYRRIGGRSDAGNKLIIDEIHQPGGGVPRRMAPLVLIGTLATHLFGGSAGREGTAVQMGGSMAAAVGRALRVKAASMRLLLMAGVAAGFGSVFGTPIAGAIFAIEVLIIGRLQYDALIPCFIASLVAHWSCMAWGIHHTAYPAIDMDLAAMPDPLLLGKVALAAALLGLVGTLFAWSCHQLSAAFKRWIRIPLLRPAVGGVLVILLFWIVGTPDYLGLGTLAGREGAITLPAMFSSGEIPGTAWLWKLAFTVVTLSAGFKGGEVTPLFFIGAALGNALAFLMGAPVEVFAAIGLVAIFAAATNTPIASTLLGMELFGTGLGIYLGTACIIAYFCSGHQGIYASQRLEVPKFGRRGSRGSKGDS
ncbi:MAG: voltage-gated chloride channel family protein [Akkermansiaceae bacterium]|nr:voltage-gated chloride channel family protein [Akkermansiaceae bacterium]